jgi:hypothetical protein
MFGSLRPLEDIAYLPVCEAEDTVDFLGRMRDIDARVGKTLNELHEKETQAINKKQQAPETFQVSDQVWYL